VYFIANADRRAYDLYTAVSLSVRANRSFEITVSRRYTARVALARASVAIARVASPRRVVAMRRIMQSIDADADDVSRARLFHHRASRDGRFSRLCTRAATDRHR
jgi:hypothetical protein